MKSFSEWVSSKKTKYTHRVRYYHDHKDHAGHDSFDSPYDAKRYARTMRRRGYKVSIQNLRK